MDRLSQPETPAATAGGPSDPAGPAGGKPAQQPAKKLLGSSPLGLSKGSFLYSRRAAMHEHARKPAPQRPSSVPSALPVRGQAASSRVRGRKGLFTLREIQTELESCMEKRQANLDATDLESVATLAAHQRADQLFLEKQKHLLDQRLWQDKHDAIQPTKPDNKPGAEKAYRSAARLANVPRKSRFDRLRELKLVAQILKQVKLADPSELSEPNEPSGPNEPNRQNEQNEKNEQNDIPESAPLLNMPGLEQGSPQESLEVVARPSRSSRALSPPSTAQHSARRKSLLPQRRVSALASPSSPRRTGPSEPSITSTPIIPVPQKLHRKSLIPKLKPGDGN